MMKSNRFTILIAALALCLAAQFALSSCGPKEKAKAAPKSQASTGKLRIFALDRIRSSGFETVVLKEFARRSRTDLSLHLFPDVNSLAQALNSDEYRGKVDLALGLDNAFELSDTLRNLFTPPKSFKWSSISYEIHHDRESGLVPYGYGDLAFVYNKQAVPAPPQSFGELQDSRFYTQIGVCDPATSGLGRGALLWSVAMFGDNGFDQMWSSLRKNIRKAYPSEEAAVEALRSGECALLIGYHSLPAWMDEIYQTGTQYGFVNPQEGSFQYVEFAAICQDAPNRAAAERLVNFLLDEEAQKQVIYKLGLMPANGRTPLPLGFSSIPRNLYTQNQRIKPEQARENLGRWLKRWSELITYRPAF